MSMAPLSWLRLPSRRCRWLPRTKGRLLAPCKVPTYSSAGAGGGGITSSRQEALRLYREILKTADAFSWMDDHGRVWRDEIARSARREFEDWSGERDPELSANRIMVGAARGCGGVALPAAARV
jgi:hypothetical protein